MSRRRVTKDMRVKILLPLALTACLLALGCESPQTSAPQPSAAKPTVYAVNYPLQYMAQRIAGDAMTVVLPTPEDVDPAFWRPDGEDLQKIQAADLVLLNGAGYAQWVQSVSLRPSRLVDTSQAFADRFIPQDESVVHTHGPGGEHEHHGAAFTTWLDFRQAAQQAEAIRDAFIELLPASSEAFEQNTVALRAELQRLDDRLLEVKRDYASQPLLASHPVYQYLARRCELNLHSLHWEPDQEPDESQWSQLKLLIETHPAKWMIWEAAPLPSTRDKLAEMGVSCVVFQPCGNAPQSGDFQGVMETNIDNLRPLFKSAGS